LDGPAKFGHQNLLEPMPIQDESAKSGDNAHREQRREPKP
jgi:hypothetical protein